VLSHRAHNEYFEPRHEEWRERTLYSLYNAHTEIMKKHTAWGQVDKMAALTALTVDLLEE
jgi:hypothetical protein